MPATRKSWPTKSFTEAGISSPRYSRIWVRYPLLWVSPDQRPRLVNIRDNLIARIDEARREGWIGEAEGLKVSLAAANAKLAQADQLAARRTTAVSLGTPTFHDIVGRTAIPAKDPA